MSIESGRYVRIEDNGQQNDSSGVGRTRIQDKIRQPSCFLAHGEQVSGWAFFPYFAPIFAHRCISILHRCITKPDNAPILYPRLQNAPTDAPTAHPCTYGRTHDAPICTYGAHRINSAILRNEKYIGDALLQKTYTVNTLEKKRGANNGIALKYYVEGSHEAIIDKDVFLRVQAEIARRANILVDGKKRIYSSRYALSSIVFC